MTEECNHRNALFISHANPEDNAFVLWLGAKLAAMGYNVWADLMRLYGGTDWSRKLEHALRVNTTKMLLVCTPNGLAKQGVRNEIEIGTQTANRIQDDEFIIPLRLSPYDAPFRIAHIQYIDFSQNWMNGLAKLVELLTTVHNTPRTAQPPDDWLSMQSHGRSRLIRRPESLTSNWLRPLYYPSRIRYCKPPSGFSLDLFRDRSRHRWPVVPFKNGVLTFAKPDPNSTLPPNLPTHSVLEIPFGTFRRAGWKQLSIKKYEADRLFADLGNQAFDRFMKNRGLESYEGSNGRNFWWADKNTVSLSQISFNWPTHNGRRKIIGLSKKRGIYWHFATNGQFRTDPIVHLRLSSRLVFSENGIDALKSIPRMHQLRRSFAKSWRNARWRDLLLAYLWWLCEGRSSLRLSLSDDQELLMSLPTMSFLSPVSAKEIDNDPADDDLDERDDTLGTHTTMIPLINE